MGTSVVGQIVMGVGMVRTVKEEVWISLELAMILIAIICWDMEVEADKGTVKDVLGNEMGDVMGDAVTWGEISMDNTPSGSMWNWILWDMTIRILVKEGDIDEPTEVVDVDEVLVKKGVEEWLTSSTK